MNPLLVIFCIIFLGHTVQPKYVSGYNLVLNPGTIMKHGYLNLDFEIVLSMSKTEVASQKVPQTLLGLNEKISQLIEQSNINSTKKQYLLKLNKKNRSANVSDSRLKIVFYDDSGQPDFRNASTAVL